MLGRTHLVVGIFLSTFFSSPIVWLSLLIGSILPDIDNGSSILGRKVKMLGFAFKHRRFFHSFFFLIPITILAYAIKPSMALGLSIGLASHLILDMVTKQGVRLYPFKKRIKGPIKVGGLREKLFFIVTIFCTIFRLFLM